MKRIKRIDVRGRGAVGSRIDDTSLNSFPPSTRVDLFGPFKPGERVVIDVDSSSDSSSEPKKSKKTKKKKSKSSKKHKKHSKKQKKHSKNNIM
jgi:hypothetical protein